MDKTANVCRVQVSDTRRYMLSVAAGTGICDLLLHVLQVKC